MLADYLGEGGLIVIVIIMGLVGAFFGIEFICFRIIRLFKVPNHIKEDINKKLRIPLRFEGYSLWGVRCRYCGNKMLDYTTKSRDFCRICINTDCLMVEKQWDEAGLTGWEVIRSPTNPTKLISNSEKDKYGINIKTKELLQSILEEDVQRYKQRYNIY